jgi:hypothetical protein
MKTSPRALLQKRGALTLGELAEAIAGEPISGSWWAHPKGKLIFNLASALEDAPGVLACKLGGRVTFVDEALFPALYRVVTDESFRARAAKTLSPAAKSVVKRAARGPLRLDKKDLTSREKAALEKACILHISSEHTESGRHATIVRTWESWASAATKRAAAKLTLELAKEALRKSSLLV